MSGAATSSPHRDQRPAAGSAEGSAWVVVAVGVLALVVGVGVTVVPSWWEGLRGTPADEPAYAAATRAAPLRLSARLSRGELVAPVISSTVEPHELLTRPPDDAPLVSWWGQSAPAGSRSGQTVLVAHADGESGGLVPVATLMHGDHVDLLTDQGTVRYEVDSVRALDPVSMTRLGVSLFKQDGGGGRLVMVSAEDWDGLTYQRSVVATARPLGRPVR